jgi:hypothetical protein
MALPRPLLLALVGLVLAAGAYFATSSSRQAVDDVPVAENVQPAPGSDADAPAGADKKDSVAVETDKPAQKDGGAEKEANLREANAKGEGGKADAKADDKPARADAKPDRARTERVRSTPAPAGPAARLQRALRQNAVVVMFFRQRGADDDATADAVASVRGDKGVGVMVLPIGKSPRYSAAIGTTVTRAPSVVVLARKRQPLLMEGYIDSASLAQAVADAR